jgi:iron complex transport system ATP-binding protein
MMTGLQARELTVAAGGRRLLDHVGIDIAPGYLTAVIGPNGAGKSTLLRALCGDLTPQSGTVMLNGRPLASWSAQERALQRAVLPQTPELAFSFRAWDVVELGRHPHRHRATREQDHAAICEAMMATDTSEFAQRDCGTLSGGEKHRTHFARTLAQIWGPLADGRARLLLLDEPTASLDLFHQHAILAKARAVAHSGAAVLTVLHDLNLAAAYADTLVVLDGGRADAAGSPGEVLTCERITRIWRVRCAVEKDEDGAIQVRVRRGAPIAEMARLASPAPTRPAPR